jgi:lipooligosaccharide transport system permease protein
VSKNAIVTQLSAVFTAYSYLNKAALKVLWRNLVVLQKTWVTNMAFYFIEPLLYLSAMGFGLGVFVGEINGISYVQFIAPGIIASSAMWAAAAECTYGSFVRMHYQKVFHAMLATPLELEEIVTGEILTGVCKSVIYGSVILVVIAGLGLVASPWALLVPFVLILAGLIFAALGMIWTGLVPKIDTFSFFFTLVITPMFLFSGVFFPLESLPGIMQSLAWLMPLYHIVVIIRTLVLGEPSLFLLVHGGWLALLALLLFPIPLRLMKKRLGV